MLHSRVAPVDVVHAFHFSPTKNVVYMATLEDIVRKQKAGAQFVITAPMLKLTPQQFDGLAQQWLDDGGPGFNVIGIPHRSVVDGEFFISRITVIRTTAEV